LTGGFPGREWCAAPGSDPVGTIARAGSDLQGAGAAAAVARSVSRPKRGVPSAFGSRRDVVCGERVDGVVPASRLAAYVTDRHVAGAVRLGVGDPNRVRELMYVYIGCSSYYHW